MMNYEENPIVKGVLFMSSMKLQENVEQMVMQIKVQCAGRNILVEDMAVEYIKEILEGEAVLSPPIDGGSYED